MKKIFLIVIPLFFSSAVLAGGSVGFNKVDELAFNSIGLFLYSKGWSNANDCDSADAVVLLESGPNFENAYALLLAAYMSGKEVVGYSSSCVEFDGKTYNTIRGHKYLRVR